MRIKLNVTYDGTNFNGWQVQPEKRSVQQTIEDAIFTLTGERVRVTASGRTDAGVHAENQTAHFDTNSTIPPEKFREALNIILPEDVKILASEKTDDNFDARKNAKRKTYLYRVYQSRVEKPLKNRFAIRVMPNLNVEKMQKASQIFVGEHDFKCFCASGSSVLSTVRTVYEVKVESVGEDVNIYVTGNGFLYNMVRIMAGTLLKVGYGDLTENDVKEMLEKGKRELGGKTVSARGLTLLSVEYE